MQQSEAVQRSAVVFGVGPARGLGAAIARRFARENFRLTILGRSAEKLGASADELRVSGAVVTSIVGDVTDAALVHAVIGAADLPEAPLEAAIFNAGGNRPNGLLDMDAAFFENMWRVNALAGLFFAQAAIKAMLPRKARRRAVHRRQRLAARPRQFRRLRIGEGGPARHRAIRRPRIRPTRHPRRPRHPLLPALKEMRGPDGLLDPDAIAENYWHLYQQPRSAWTHELDLRPWAETW
ncbi:MAG: SDR family NAD(P)-dependent oxidoreductase [Rhodospirillales bacterium]